MDVPKSGGIIRNRELSNVANSAVEFDEYRLMEFENEKLSFFISAKGNSLVCFES